MGPVVICGSEVVDIPVFAHGYDLLAACQICHGYQPKTVDLHRRKWWFGKGSVLIAIAQLM